MSTTTEPRGPAETRTCVTCGQSFSLDPGFYRDNGLTLPRACAPCRRARRERLVPARGRVVRETRTGGLLVIEAGRDAFVAHPTAGVAMGAAVAFLFDPQEDPPAGRLRFARRLVLDNNGGAR